MTMGDPWAPIVTHAIVELPRGPEKSYSHVLDAAYVNERRPHPDNENFTARRDWPFQRIVDVFSQHNPTYSKRGPVIVQAQWLKDSVDIGYPLGAQHDWGGWLVR